MLRRFSINFALFSIGLDALLIVIALAAASHVRPLLSFLPFASDVRNPMELPFQIYPIFLVLWIGVFTYNSVYDGRKNLRVTDEMTSVFLSSIFAGICSAGALYLTYRGVSRVLFLTFVLIAYLSLASWRLVARGFFKLAKGKAFANRQVLIVGAGQIGRDFKEKISAHSYLGVSVAGFLDDDQTKSEINADILGTIDEAKAVIEREKIDDVVIALPQRAHERLNQLVAELHELPVKVHVIPDYYNQSLHKAVIEEFAGIPMLDLRAPALNYYQRVIKRAFDLGVAILVLPISLILMAVIAIIIRLEGPGSILFRQQRVGENGRLFNMYKFRSMIPDAEEKRYLVEQYDEEGNLIHKTAFDPRVTRIGRFLRRLSLDEIPQLFNVIKGDMSIIGPRPELPYLVQQYEPWQRTRFAVPQGITGWWQVNGRSDKPMHLNTEDDLYYVHNYSLFLDLQILVKTVGVVLRGKGAF